MAEATLVDMHLKDGQRLINQLVQGGVSVTAAAWVRESDSGDWYLYLATPLVSEGGGKRAAYRRVNEVIRALPAGRGLRDGPVCQESGRAK